MSKITMLLLGYLSVIIIVLGLLLGTRLLRPSTNDIDIHFTVSVENVSYSPNNETSGILNFTVLPNIPNNQSLWMTGYRINDTEVDIPNTEIFTNHSLTIRAKSKASNEYPYSRRTDIALHYA